LTNVLVVAMKDESGIRRMWEDRFVAELEKYGVKATPSYSLYPVAPPDTLAVRAAVQDNNYDGLLMTINLPTRAWLTFYPPDYWGWGGWRWHDWDDWYGSYGFYYGLAYGPGFFDATTEVRNRTEVWSTLGKGALEWTATSEVFNPISSTQVAKSVADKVVPVLARQGLIYGKK
jgi:hypothetical protein